MKIPQLCISVLAGICIYLCICIPSSAYAAAPQSDFQSGYDISYSVDQSGSTHAIFNGSLTNESSRNYATSYTITVQFPHISNVLAHDSAGTITPAIIQISNGYRIKLHFNAKIVGLHNTLHFTLTFDTSDIARQNGKIWEINIPGLANQSLFDNYQIAVHVPPSFGIPSLVKPYLQPGAPLIFTKNELGSSGVSLAFGTTQTYSLTLAYHIVNTNVFPIKTEIALPPSTNYQTVAIQNISPRPQNVIEDQDGNWLAQYYLLPAQKLSITVQALAFISLNPQKQTLSPEEKSIYTSSQNFWQTSDSSIEQLAKKLKTPENIYLYVVHALTYDDNRVLKNEPRVGAAGVYKNPKSAVCLEFTDLFIALSRAAGIPAREVDGYGFTQNTYTRPLSEGEDILHAWPEYYDVESSRWIMVDPTWGNTTNGIDYFHSMDFDHIAFVIRGIHDDYPIPAGGYKTNENTATKDISVQVSTQTYALTQQLLFSPGIAQKYMSGLPMDGFVQVKNEGHILTSTQYITVQSAVLSPHTQTITIPPIPPFGSVQKPFSFEPVAFLTNNTYTFTIQLAGKTINGSLTATPLLVTRNTIIGGIIFVLFTTIIWIIAGKARRIHVPK